MERLGRYNLIERIGSGGMCDVYRARKDGHREDVALKRLRPEMEAQSKALDLFLTEADISVLLHHPNLVNTLESDEVQGHYYIAMELIDGLDLAHALREGPEQDGIIDTPLALHIAIEACRGLHYLHEACSPSGRHFELVHRDVSPDNIFLTRAGQVKVADFGIAKLGKLESVTSVLGGVKGKIAYMAPEQIRGEHLDGRADLFALALILYEMVTGLRPYALRDGESDLEQALRVRDADIPAASKIYDEVPSELDAILRQALQRKSRKRHDSCEALAFDLENLVVARGWQRSAKDVTALVERLRPRI
ncbi:MAG: serine/threonine-protein kinase [Pseudomonadota bacterium]